ncbi:NAD(P)H-hydrate dehydratase [Pelagerythrobacter sp.]|uniref:NAD(P)H-hydrate dehydratase n=1 Tax=Pelagerythrobacter sp. TaxID=2800702 RepID=UPI0035B25764
MPPNNPVLMVAEMQAAEQALIDAGTGVDALMQRAGRGAAEWVWRMAAGRPVTVLCGPGNNGGDGYVIAEVLRGRGIDVMVVAPVEPKTGAAQNARALYEGEIVSGANERQGALLVDCLFGSGLTRPLSNDLLALLTKLADRHGQRIAIDLPSGVESDSGALLNPDLPRNDLTLALGAWKFAHWTMPASATMGARRLVDIGVRDTVAAATLSARPHLDPPAPDAHKYRRGLLAVVAGAMPGAGLLAATAAMHGGAGYVKLLADRSHPAVPAALVVDERPLAKALGDERIAALLIGPGLGRDGAARERLGAVLDCCVPLVLDADALMLLECRKFTGEALVTPHEGELAALCDTFGVSGEGKRGKAQALAAASGLTVLAKGPDTVLCAPDGTTRLFAPGPSWLSTAGTGDVLAGIAASRLATGLSAFTAAEQAVWLHHEAARIAGAAFTASELAQAVKPAYARFL